jgi:hypothetical protein
MSRAFGRLVLRDRGSNFTASFDAVFQAVGTRIPAGVEVGDDRVGDGTHCRVRRSVTL